MLSTSAFLKDITKNCNKCCCCTALHIPEDNRAVLTLSDSENESDEEDIPDVWTVWSPLKQQSTVLLSASRVPSESLGSRPGSVVTGRDREGRGATHNWPWPSVVRVRKGLVGRDVLVSSLQLPYGLGRDEG